LKNTNIERRGTMPTGYTAKLMEEGQSFNDFILGCARAFGACVTMRDDSSDKPIPEKFEPTDYHVKKIEEAKALLSTLQNMTNDEKIRFGENKKSEEVVSSEAWLEKRQVENSRLAGMESQVKAWTPPTPDHKGLKDFMLQQISISKNGGEYIQEEIRKAKAKAPMSYYIQTVSDANRDINYHTEENKKEIERVNSRNEWLRQLRNSI